MTTTAILCPVEYYKRIVKKQSLKWLCGLTDSHYPRFLALGWYFPSSNEMIVCKICRWKLRLLHEQGHSVGLKHVKKIGCVMHPWGILRGYNGKEEIEELVNSSCESQTYLQTVILKS